MSGPNINEYNPIIPNANDFLATSQKNFLVNFQQLYDAFLMNHVPLDDAVSGGNHTLIELLQQSQGPGINVGEISIYSKEVEGQTDQLFLRFQNGVDVQITNYQLYNFPQVVGRNEFFTFLPGKILIYYGIVSIPDYPFELTLNPPVSKNIISMNFCPGGTPSFPPIADPITSTNKIITKIKLVTPFSLPITNELMFYLVVANI